MLGLRPPGLLSNPVSGGLCYLIDLAILRRFSFHLRSFSFIRCADGVD